MNSCWTFLAVFGACCVLSLVGCSGQVGGEGGGIVLGDPSRWLLFLENNMVNTCAPAMPLSYYVYPADYFSTVPADEQVAPPDRATVSKVFPECGSTPVSTSNQDAYTFQTERLVSQFGLNIYDGSLWMISLSLLKQYQLANSYYRQVLQTGKTCEFQSIYGDAPCGGLVITGKCKTNCGFCYGDNPLNQSLTAPSAWFFKAISAFFTPNLEPDARCPDHLYWNWNTWDPVLGENSWARLIGPIQSAYIESNKNPLNISTTLIDAGIDYVESLTIMQIPELGAIYYAPHNTYKSDFSNGAQISTENQVSTLAGLNLLAQLIQAKNYRTGSLETINSLITGLKKFIRTAYDPTSQLFRAGLHWNWINKVPTWMTEFAVDCQTWTLSVLGESTVDNWFGVGSTIQIVNNTLKLGGYKYDGSVAYGLGYSNNDKAQVLSGEWTFGGINALLVLAENSQDPNEKLFLNTVVSLMRTTIENEITQVVTINSVTVEVVNYANKRYYIPFGWWANPLPAVSSTAWAVFVDSQFNPFYLGGDYLVYS